MNCRSKGCPFPAMIEGWCRAHAYMALPIEEESDSTEEAVREIFAESSEFVYYENESGVSVDDSLYVIGAAKNRKLKEVGLGHSSDWNMGKNWLLEQEYLHWFTRKLQRFTQIRRNKARHEDAVEPRRKIWREARERRNVAWYARQVEFLFPLRCRGRAHVEHIEAYWDARRALPKPPKKWDDWRDPVVGLDVGESVEMPIPEGENPSTWVPALRLNLPLSRKTRAWKFSVQTLNHYTVRVTKTERIYTIFERIAMYEEESKNAISVG